MRGIDRCPAERQTPARDLVEDQVAKVWVQVGGRLVEEEEGRVARQRPRKTNPLLFTTRKLGGQPVGERREVHPRRRAQAWVPRGSLHEGGPVLRQPLLLMTEERRPVR